jgi:hypothetical protein
LTNSLSQDDVDSDFKTTVILKLDPHNDASSAVLEQAVERCQAELSEAIETMHKACSAIMHTTHALNGTKLAWRGQAMRSALMHLVNVYDFQLAVDALMADYVESTENGVTPAFTDPQG